MRNAYQIIILGPGGVGKSKGCYALIQILSSLGFETSEVKPWNETMVTTSNYVIHNFTIPKGYFPDIDEELRIVIYDLGGQFRYKEMWEQHAKDTDAIVAVVDMTRKTTLRQIPLMLPKGIMEAVPVRLLVNKADLFTSFNNNIENIVNQISTLVEQTKSQGAVNYSILYRGDENFIFNNKIYKYGEKVSVFRLLQNDENGQLLIRLGDLEILVAQAFRNCLANLTMHNSYLFGREFTLQAFEAISVSIGTTSIFTDELLEQAHFEAPPFLSWGNDPPGTLPLNALTTEIIIKAVKSMLIDTNDLIQMVQEMMDTGYNIDISDEESWALTSATILEDKPNLGYKPMNRAVLPPSFIKKMIDYNEQKLSQSNEEEDFFV